MKTNDIRLIDKYLYKELTANELELFNDRIKSDKVFAEEFSFIKSVVKTIRKVNRKQLLKKIKTIIEDYENSDEKKKPSNTNEDFSLKTIKTLRGNDHRDYISLDDLMAEIEIEKDIYFYENLEIPQHYILMLEKLNQIKNEIKQSDIDKFKL